MEIPVPFASEAVPETPAAARRPAPAYPTLGESWGILGWYLLVNLVVGVPLYLLFSKAFVLPWGLATLLLVASPNLALLWFLRRQVGPRWQPLRLRGLVRPRFYAVLPLLMLASATVLSLLHFLHLPHWGSAGAIQKMMKYPVTASIALTVAAPIFEEALARGVVLAGLLQSRRPWVAIGQSALLFGIMHFNPAQSLNAFLLGLLLGWLYYRTESLGVCMAAHALHNALAFVAMQWGPAIWQKSSSLKGVNWAWAYAGAVGLSALVLAAVLWRVQQTTAPPAWAPGAAADEAVEAAALGTAAA